ncbi:YdcF family protein [Draconibacterium halophilum]|uniref:YdcF family protein n=1 Tax=Draconibacterium halophilum TaxID=2706887 RepID=A0A6C0RFK7_9BACT|nr:YdcF family protein [Draconibacterium halophilum]QIA08455.1 YdcF family protein [Draconibacterium halophilum]
MRLLRRFFVLIGIFFVVCLGFSFTEQPFWGYHWLGTSKAELKWKPKSIILLGGGGMPSQSNLMRSWYTEKAAKTFPEAKVIVAMPGLLSDSLSTPQLMKSELVLRGIPAERIAFEPKGTNTRSQALECQGVIKMQESILLVTSPEHMRRAVLAFRKVGFEKVNAVPAFENAAEADLSFTDDELGGNSRMIPDVGNNMNMRYQMWNHLKYEILIARELVALSYYKLRGWI